MSTLSALDSYVVEARFDKVLKMVRKALAEMELQVAGEVDGENESKTLLVDCPLLLFEALALNRAAAVFFPLHVLVSADGNQTRISVANPMRLLDGRLPVGSANPMNRLMARVEMALESVAKQSNEPKP